MAYIRFQTLQVTTTVVHFSDLILADPDHGSIPNTTLDLILDIVPPPPVADFSGSPPSGIAPLLVEFVDMSTGDYDTCSWDFGDGNSSSNCADPSDNYTSAGVYTVGLTVSGLGGSDTETKTGYITVYEPTSADFSATPTSGVAPLLVELLNLSTGDFDSCDWDFGDGGMSDDCDLPSYLYTASGVYTISLTISGPGGLDTETKTSYITVVDTYFSYIPVIIQPS
jgi:PKD repeat protein